MEFKLFISRVVKSTLGDTLDRSIDRAMGTKERTWGVGEKDRYELCKPKQSQRSRPRAYLWSLIITEEP